MALMRETREKVINWKMKIWWWLTGMQNCLFSEFWNSQSMRRESISIRLGIEDFMRIHTIKNPKLWSSEECTVTQSMALFGQKLPNVLPIEWHTTILLLSIKSHVNTYKSCISSMYSQDHVNWLSKQNFDQSGPLRRHQNENIPLITKVTNKCLLFH